MPECVECFLFLSPHRHITATSRLSSLQLGLRANEIHDRHSTIIRCNAVRNCAQYRLTFMQRHLMQNLSTASRLTRLYTLSRAGS